MDPREPANRRDRRLLQGMARVSFALGALGLLAQLVLR